MVSALRSLLGHAPTAGSQPLESPLLKALSAPGRVFRFPGTYREIDLYVDASKRTLTRIEKAVTGALAQYHGAYTLAELACRDREGKLSLLRAQSLNTEACEGDLLTEGDLTAHNTGVAIGVLLLNWGCQSPDKRQRYQALHDAYDAVRHRSDFFVDAYTYSAIPLKQLMKKYEEDQRESFNEAKQRVFRVIEEFLVVVHLHRQTDTPAQFQACIEPLIEELMDTIGSFKLGKRTFQYRADYYSLRSSAPDSLSRSIDGIEKVGRDMVVGEYFKNFFS